MLTAICVCLPLICLMGCEGITELGGRITDPQNSPIQGAEVVLEEVGTVYPVVSKGTSNENGEYNVMLTHAPSDNLDLELKISKAGYKTHKQNIKSGTSDDSFNLILEPEVEAE